MQKTLILILALLPFAAFAQKPVLQQSGYASIGGLNYFSMGYEARFRNFNQKPDYALGLAILTRNFGFRPAASLLFGKDSHAFELGLNSSIIL